MDTAAVSTDSFFMELVKLTPELRHFSLTKSKHSPSPTEFSNINLHIVTQWQLLQSIELTQKLSVSTSIEHMFNECIHLTSMSLTTKTIDISQPTLIAHLLKTFPRITFLMVQSIQEYDMPYVTMRYLTTQTDNLNLDFLSYLNSQDEFTACSVERETSLQNSENQQNTYDSPSDVLWNSTACVAAVKTLQNTATNTTINSSTVTDCNTHTGNSSHVVTMYTIRIWYGSSPFYCDHLLGVLSLKIQHFVISLEMREINRISDTFVFSFLSVRCRFLHTLSLVGCERLRDRRPWTIGTESIDALKRFTPYLEKLTISNREFYTPINPLTNTAICTLINHCTHLTYINFDHCPHINQSFLQNELEIARGVKQRGLVSFVSSQLYGLWDTWNG